MKIEEKFAITALVLGVIVFVTLLLNWDSLPAPWDATFYQVANFLHLV